MPKYTGRAVLMVDFTLEIDRSDAIQAEDRGEAIDVMKQQAREYFTSGDAFRDKNFDIVDFDAQNIREYEDENEEVEDEQS
jgi:hypothetical protein